MNVNKSIVIGRLTRDPEVKTTPNGTTLCTLSVATSTQWKDNNGQKQSKTEFHNVIAWGKQAEVIGQYFVKGQEIYVEGRLETRSWEDKDTGKKMYRTEIVLERFDFGSRPQNAAPQEPQQPKRQETVPTIDLDDTPEVEAEKSEEYDIYKDKSVIDIKDVPFN